MIDFAGFTGSSSDAARQRAIAAKIGAACRESGFFALTNHPINAGLIDDAFAMAQNFFDLSEDKKREIAIERSPCHRGWFAHGGEVLDRTKQPQGDYKEGLKIGRDLPPDHASVKAALPLHGANQYPHESGALVGFRKHMDTLYGACEALSRHLMQAFALSLDLPPDHFDRWLSEPMATLSPLRYPPMQKAEELSAGAHSDFGCLTLLFQHDVAGLEIKTKKGWQDVPLLDGAIIVNIGDMMEHWTGGLYPSTVHRVVNRSQVIRHSMAYFFDP
ncbi:MAG: isopenicillin N synthase family dioxygenase, partial [Parvibaculales bacterium]